MQFTQEKQQTGKFQGRRVALTEAEVAVAYAKMADECDEEPVAEGIFLVRSLGPYQSTTTRRSSSASASSRPRSSCR